MKGLTLKGFTLIELMVTIGIVAILSAIAVPSYVSFIERGKLVSATEELSSMRGVMEQAYLVDRTYRSGNNCIIANYTGEYFAHTCATTSKTTFTWTATSMANVGLGAAGSYIYKINQDGTKSTAKYNGTVPSSTTGWKIRE